ncbi:hypothetical protein [Ilumatobacter sp.]|uniref:hypothetical protein n=1 Tax=Ilumatobacter sp. TaxID=1967498 RepID=UPI003C40B54F
MTVWKLKSRRSGIAGSDYRPQGAGAHSLRCDFLDPAPEGTDAVGTDGTLRVRAEVAANYESKTNPGSFIPAVGSHGISDMRIALRRGTRTWMGNVAWVTLDPMMAQSFRSVPVQGFTVVEEPNWGTLSAVIDETIDARLLGPGPVTVSVYLEGHPRELVRHRKYGWDPRVAGVFTNTVLIDGESPETFVDDVLPTGSSAFIVGRATDNHRVERVLLTVTDDETGLTLGADRRWSQRAVPLDIPVDDDGVWSWSMPSGVAAGSGRYSFVAQAEDAAERDRTRANKQRRGNLDPSPVRIDP